LVAFFHAQILECCILAVDDNGPMAEVSKQVRRVISLESEAAILREIYRIQPGGPQFAALMLHLRRNIEQAVKELTNRVKPGVGAVTLLARMWPSLESIGKAFLTVLKIDEVSDYQERDNESGSGKPTDLRQDVIVRALDALATLEQRATAGLPERISAPPLLTLALGKRWDRERLYAQTMKSVIGQLLPVFDGEVETLPRVARQAYRDYFEHRDAKKRGGRGSRHAKAAGTEQDSVEKIPWDDAALAPEALTGVEREGDTPEDLAIEAEHRDLRRQKIAALYRFVQKRWGLKGRLFLEGLEAGCRLSRHLKELA
jgi:hypothetical protein